MAHLVKEALIVAAHHITNMFAKCNPGIESEHLLGIFVDEVDIPLLVHHNERFRDRGDNGLLKALCNLALVEGRLQMKEVLDCMGCCYNHSQCMGICFQIWPCHIEYTYYIAFVIVYRRSGAGVLVEGYAVVLCSKELDRFVLDQNSTDTVRSYAVFTGQSPHNEVAFSYAIDDVFISNDLEDVSLVITERADKTGTLHALVQLFNKRLARANQFCILSQEHVELRPVQYNGDLFQIWIDPIFSGSFPGL